MRARMEKFFVQCIGMVFDWVPYVVGRLAVFVLTWDTVRCERWQPLVWSTDLRTQPWWDRVDGRVYVTRNGARWIGAIVLAAVIAGMFAGVLWLILKMNE